MEGVCVLPVKVLSREEKERILSTLEVDREFRYALMGLLGFKELLERFSRLEERQSKLEERQQRLEERQLKLEERFARLEERQQKLEERFARIEERQQKLEERFSRLEERQLKLEERFALVVERQQRLEERQLGLEERMAKVEERLARVEEELRDTRRLMFAISHRFGMISEAGFREAMKYVVQEVLRVAKVEKWVYRDEEGVVYGYPSVIEVDVAVHDKTHILVEVKSRVSRGDIAELARIRDLYEKVKGVKAKAVVIGGFIDPKAYESASKLNVEVKPMVEEKQL